MEEAPPSHAPSSQPEIHPGAERPPAAKNITAAAPIYLPDTGITLAKLPPITDKVDLLPPNYPKAVLLQEKPRFFAKGSAPAGTLKKSKEPKFVPYEPYKGAVKPFFDVPTKPRQQWTPERKLSQQQRAPVERIVVEEPERGVSEKGVSEETEQLEQNYRAMLEAKEKEIDRLRQSLQTAEKQLRIQTQVKYKRKKESVEVPNRNSVSCSSSSLLVCAPATQATRVRFRAGTCLGCSSRGWR
jgi:hypothetical protein